MDEQLHAASGLAAYTWGSLVLETTRAAPVDGELVVRTLAGLAAGAFPAKSAKQQRSAIAVIHELVHLQQDLATGLGAWDHVTTRVPYLRLASQSRWFITAHDEPPYPGYVPARLEALGHSAFTDQVLADLTAIRDDTVARRQLHGESWATPQARAFVEGRVGQRLTEHNVAELSLRVLFEGEAAAVTFNAVQGTGHEPDALEWLTDHADLWWLSSMPEDYRTALGMLAQSMGIDVEDVPEADAAQWVGALARSLSWAVDLACAYPSPAELAEWPADPAAFEPVARFAEIVRALNRLDAYGASGFLDALNEDRWADAEAIVLPCIDLPYAPSSETYDRWLTMLGPLAEADDWDAQLFGLRVDAIRARRVGGNVKGLQAMVDAATPVQVMVQGLGMRGISHGKHWEHWPELAQAFVDRRLDMELFDLFHGNGVFRCPYGRAAPCPGQRDVCMDGIRHLRQLPSEDVCYVRRSLASAGWSLPGTEVTHA